MMLGMEAVFDEYPNPLFITKPIVEEEEEVDFSYIYVNHAFAHFIGKSVEELIGKCFSEVFGKEKAEKHWLDFFYESAVNGKYLHEESDSLIIGKKLYVEIFHIDPDMCGCIIQDYSRLNVLFVTREEHDRLEMAKYDCLTGVYSRTYLKELENSIVRESGVGIVYLDLNNLKEVNDAYGHEAGDRLICEFVNSLQHLFPEGLIFRIGGDEFLVIYKGVEKELFLSRAGFAWIIFNENKMAAVGYRYYEKIDVLSAAIKECDMLMYGHKRDMKSDYGEMWIE